MDYYAYLAYQLKTYGSRQNQSATWMEITDFMFNATTIGVQQKSQYFNAKVPYITNIIKNYTYTARVIAHKIPSNRFVDS